MDSPRSRAVWVAALDADEYAPFSVDAYTPTLIAGSRKELDQAITIKAVYAYDGGALSTLPWLTSKALRAYMSIPTVYWRLVQQLQREEAELHPIGRQPWALSLTARRTGSKGRRAGARRLSSYRHHISPETASRTRPDLKRRSGSFLMAMFH